MTVLINIDVPDIRRGVAFYTQAFGLKVHRRFGRDGVELAGWPVAVFLLKKDGGTIGAADQPRDYARHWTPVHVDVVVADIDAALIRAVRAGAVVEHPTETAVWGKIAMLADPFGHGVCLIQFLNRGYDEIAEPLPSGA